MRQLGPKQAWSHRISWVLVLFLLCGPVSCLSGEDRAARSAEGLAPTPDPAGTRVRFDPLAKPMPEIPFPNDLATVMDGASPTGRRLNIRMEAPTALEQDVRANINQLDGFGTFSPITVSFERPLDLRTVEASNILLVNVDPASPRFGDSIPLDFPPCDHPESAADHPDWTSYPLVIEGTPCSEQHPCGTRSGQLPLMDFGYFHFDYHWRVNNLMFEGNEEDKNCDGFLAPGEDLDFDGVLDHPNIAYHECYNQACFGPPGNAKGASPYPEICPEPFPWDDEHPENILDDKLVTNFEYETNTLILRPLVALEQRTRYAVVLTRGLRDISGNPVCSPFPAIHHANQTESLRPLVSLLPQRGIPLSQVAFAWSFTTQTITQGLEAIRDGLRGKGALSHLAAEFPAELDQVLDHQVCSLGECDEGLQFRNTRILKPEKLEALFRVVMLAMTFSWIDLGDLLPMIENLVQVNRDYLAYYVVGWYKTPMLLDGPDSHFDIDFTTGRARVRDEWIPFWLAVPKTRKDLSGQVPGWYPDPPFPVAFYGHGYSGAKFEALGFAGHLARFGFATFAMDETGHGPAKEMADLINVLDQLAQDDQGNDIGLDDILDEVASFCPLLKDLILDGLAQLVFEYTPPVPDQDWQDLLEVCKNDWWNEDPDADKCTQPGECPAKCLVLKFSQTPLFEGAFLSGRAVDLTGDGLKDSGVDFWTARSFHTRDIVRQSVVDYMQALRVLRSFDGQRLWDFDVNDDGTVEKAGDFNADGVVDVGGLCAPDYSSCNPGDPGCVPGYKDCDPDDPDDPNRQNYVGMGQSMGAFIVSILQAVDPGISVVAPVSGGAGLEDIGMRTSNEGVREAVYLEVMGPMLIGGTKRDICRRWTYYDVCDEEEEGLEGVGDKDWLLAFDALDGNLEKIWPIAPLPVLKEGDRVRVRNLSNGEESSRGVVSFGNDEEGAAMLGFRVNIPADRGDRLLVEVFDGASEEPAWRTETTSIGKGYGYERNTPDLRRMMGLSQLILDPADPVNYAPHYFWDPLPGMKPKGILINHTLGDMKVPIGTGLTLGRAARILDYESPVAVFGGDTENEMYVKHYVAEAIPRIGRFAGMGKGYYFDADDLGEGMDDDCSRGTYPGRQCEAHRLNEPHLPDDPGYLEAGVEGSYLTRFFRKTLKTPGADSRNHSRSEYSGLRLPNIMVYDNALKVEDRHGIFLSAPTKSFNMDQYVINLIGRYFQTRGAELLGDLESDNATCLEDRKDADGNPDNPCAFWEAPSTR